MMTEMAIAEPKVNPKRPRRRAKATASLFWAFLRAARAWGVKNADHLAKIYVVGESGEFFMYFVAKSIAFDFPLTKSHSDFCITLWQTDGIVVHGSQIPDGDFDELSAFFDPTTAFTLTPV